MVLVVFVLGLVVSVPVVALRVVVDVAFGVAHLILVVVVCLVLTILSWLLGRTVGRLLRDH